MNASGQGRRIGIIGIAVAVALLASACGWSQSRYDAGRTGNNPFEQAIGPASVASLASSWNTGDAVGYGEVLVQAGRAVVQGGNAVRVFEAATGDPLWSAPLTPITPTTVTLPRGIATARTTGGQDLVVSGDRFFERPGQPVVQGGQLAAYDAATGTPVWSRPIQPLSAPVVVDQTLYVTAMEGPTRPPTFTGLLALDLASGATRFRTAVADPGPSLAVAGPSVVVGTSTGFAIVPAAGCGAASCPVAWHGAGAARFGTAVAVSNGRIFVASGSGLEAYPAAGCGSATCAPAWNAVGAFGGVAIAGGHVFAAGGQTTVSALHIFAEAGCGAPTCTPVWTSASGAFGTPSVANGLVYAGGDDGAVVAWLASGCGAPTCAGLWSAPAGDRVAAVTIADGRLYASGPSVQTFALPH